MSSQRYEDTDGVVFKSGARDESGRLASITHPIMLLFAGVIVVGNYILAASPDFTAIGTSMSALHQQNL